MLQLMTKTDDRIEQFWAWVEAAMEDRGLTYHAVERKAGVSNAAIWRRARHRRPPTHTTYEALSTALNVPRRELMVRAGDLAPEERGESEYARFCELGRQLSPDELQTVIRFMHYQWPERFDIEEG